MESKKHAKLGRKIVKISALGIAGLCLLVVLTAAISNLFLPRAPEDLQQLSTETVLYSTETLNLLNELGSEIWPKFGGNIPIIVWNEKTAFLVNYRDHPEGWEKIDRPMINGYPVYRQPNTKPYQAFAEPLVNGTWTGSMATKNAMNHEFIQLFQQNLPPMIKRVFPYQLLLLSTDLYITTLAHETFHAFQAEHYPEKFVDAEQAYSKRSAYEGLYEGMSGAWASEIECLQSALGQENPEEQKALVQKFLDLRAHRRDTAGLTPNLELYEKRFEWLEGSAKYVELEIWKKAALSSYRPTEDILEDRRFNAYQGYENRWESELKNMETAAKNGGETLFYYSGMLQARLLDNLMPDWKNQIGEPGFWLEDLLKAAIS